MKVKVPVLHFVTVVLAFGFLTGCKSETNAVIMKNDGEAIANTPTVTVSTFVNSTKDFAESMKHYVEGRMDDAQLHGPTGIVVDKAGHLYVADQYFRICKITSKGKISTFVGDGTFGYADGIGHAARFSFLEGIAIDAAGNLYVADSTNHRIRKVTPAGEVSTLAGSEEGFADGAGSTARFNRPHGIAIDSSGNLYVADRVNNRIRKITPIGEVSTFAGSGEMGNDDGVGAAAQFRWPTGIAIDAADNLYVADTYNHRVRKITPKGEVSSLAGNEPGAAGYADGIGYAAQFNYPKGIVVDAAGNIYVADSDSSLIRKVTPAGEVSTLAGRRKEGYADGPGDVAWLYFPGDIAIDPAGNLYVVEQLSNRIRKIVIK